jgi:hypothetical protein
MPPPVSAMLRNVRAGVEQTRDLLDALPDMHHYPHDDRLCRERLDNCLKRAEILAAKLESLEDGAPPAFVNPAGFSSSSMGPVGTDDSLIDALTQAVHDARRLLRDVERLSKDIGRPKSMRRRFFRLAMTGIALSTIGLAAGAVMFAVSHAIVLAPLAATALMFANFGVSTALPLAGMGLNVYRIVRQNIIDRDTERMDALVKAIMKLHGDIDVLESAILQAPAPNRPPTGAPSLRNTDLRHLPAADLAIALGA